jgi:UDP-glucose 4-epimerase
MNHRERMKGKKVMVTGGLGFVGHNLVRSLAEDYGCGVIVVDDCSNSSAAVLGGLAGAVELHELSVLDTDRLFPLMDRCDYVFHLACRTILTCGHDPLMDLRVNAESTLLMLEHLRRNRRPDFEKFVYASSCSVYGSSRNLPAREDGVTSTLSQYAATKLLGENYTRMYNALYDLPTASVRYSNVYGYGQTPRNPYCGVLGKFVHNALTGRPLTIFGDGEQTRDYTFVADTIDATIVAAVHPKGLGEVFNVGTGMETSVNELARLIAGEIGGVRVEHAEERDIDNVRRRAVDTELIRTRLGWFPRVTIQQGIGKTVAWYRGTL